MSQFRKFIKTFKRHIRRRLHFIRCVPLNEYINNYIPCYDTLLVRSRVVLGLGNRSTF